MRSTTDAEADDAAFPHSLKIDVPFPTHRLASIALRSIAVDEELSNLVIRDFSLATSSTAATATTGTSSTDAAPLSKAVDQLRVSTSDPNASILHVHYRATTARMLRVAVNGFFESLNVVLQVMRELDLDVLHDGGLEDLGGVQGVEQGQTGTAMGVGS